MQQVRATFKPCGEVPLGRCRANAASYRELGDGDAAMQPVLITVEEGNPNAADIVFYVGGAQPSDWTALDGLARVVLLFDGRDEGALSGARAAWRDARAAGHDVTYWKESPSGKFEKQN